MKGFEMRTGMLWFDNSSRSLNEKVADASAFYKDKYGHSPTLCFVNPTTLEGKEGRSNGVEVRETRTVMPDHFWIGINPKDSTNGNGHQV
jgi:hypothetical protein